MQPTKSQVDRSLDALRHESEVSAVSLLSTSDGDSAIERPHHDTITATIEEVPPAVLEHLAETPDVRADHVEEARAHLEHGDVCSADELAERIVDRLVCDRLR